MSEYNNSPDRFYEDKEVIKHQLAMTTEGLHGKFDIAVELGWRDKQIAAKDAEIARLKYSIEMYQGAAKKAAIQENSDVHLIKALSDETEQLKAQLAAHREFVVLYRAGLRPLYEICNDIDVGYSLTQ